ncbi:MAG: esterase family protein [Candidatus Eremiobacteraeota bacterium]|nr:esterase family protein [Candidatus Eremiobacteraeota bacterium]
MPQNPYATLLAIAGDLSFDFIESPALARNGLGDSPRKPVIVYTPPGYDASGSHCYPAIYILHGYSGDSGRLIAASNWERNVVQRADTLASAGRMRPSIVVLVDGFTRLGGSQYVDSVASGAYATYVVRDVVGHVDAHYRSIRREGGRAVAGKSSGGFGAMHLCLQHPGVFCAFASHSGDAYFEALFPQTFVQAQRVLERFDFDIERFVVAFENRHKRGQPEFDTMMILAMAAAYSPRSNAPFAIDLPFDCKTGEVVCDVFARWLAFDPANRIERCSAELQRLRLRYLDCGRRDEYGLDASARIVAQRMRDCGLEVRHEEFDDDHRNVGYRYEISLPALASVLDEGL